MSETLLSSRNLAFELYEVLDAEGLTQRERFAEHNRETFDAAIGTARSIAEKFFAPHNRKGDENEPRYENGAAILIPEVKPAVDAFLEAGFLNAARSFEAGGKTAVISTVNGDSNVPFYKELANQAMLAPRLEQYWKETINWPSMVVQTCVAMMAICCLPLGWRRSSLVPTPILAGQWP